VSDEPFFSIVTPVYDPPLDVLEATLDSVLQQTFDDWELILVDDASPNDSVRDMLRGVASRDARVRVLERAVNGHIVAASNDGITAARGQYIALLDHDDLLVDTALEEMHRAIEAAPDTDYAYSDEDKVAADGSFYDEFRKPPWSPERLRGQMYTSHLSVLRTSLVREVGGFREGFDGSQDHDLVLRVTERAARVTHVPKVLYHWRAVAGSAAHDPDAKPYAWIAGRDAVQSHVDRVGIPGVVEFGPVPGTYHVVRSIDPTLLVSVVIPTRGGEGLVWGERRTFVVEAVRSVLAKGGHANVQIVVVYDTGTPEDVLDELRHVANDRLVLVEYSKPFNFSEKCNVGVLASSGEVIVLLNDDIQLASDEFLVQLVGPIFEDGVGLTGARLLFSDSTMQHAGLAFYRNHLSHMFYKMPNSEAGPFNALAVSRECSGLTGACLAIRRSVYDEIGGFTESLPVNYNDCDFSFKIRYLGLSRIWVANTTAYHFESQTREPVTHRWEYEIIAKRWTTPRQDLYVPDYGLTRGDIPKAVRQGRSGGKSRRSRAQRRTS
jgi:glycosyltransferase involved in cell wall biosynthesis